MFRRENYIPHIAVGTLLSLAILVTFQLYQMREPVRLEADASRDKEEAITAGRELYQQNCAVCHGAQGEGLSGPPLNSKQFLTTVSDEQMFSLIRTGIPGTSMPAWAQDFGGLFTDQEVRQLVAFIRAWEPGAADAATQPRVPDPQRGAEIFGSVCAVCHGAEGQGTDQAPALNDPQLLGNFDDDWFRETIAQGRPSKGMPTWGTVLSPEEIDDLVALINLWDQGAEAPLPEPAPAPSGEQVYVQNCAACHGAQGEGGVGPALKPNAFIQGASDDELKALLLNGRPGTAMMAFQGQLNPAELEAVMQLLRAWQP